MTLTSPRQKTIKRLFAVSGNQCYFPNCKNPLVDKESGKVTGKICHIKGRKPGAARYDPNQTDEERHGFDNLVLMCSIHHDVIDDDPVSYTGSRLKEMKVEHEKNHFGGKEPSDEIVNQFILNLNEGSVIHSKDQKGGQIAHSIININYQETEREEERPEDKIKLRCYSAIEEIVHFCIDHFDYNTNQPQNNIPVNERQNIIHEISDLWKFHNEALDWKINISSNWSREKATQVIYIYLLNKAVIEITQHDYGKAMKAGIKIEETYNMDREFLQRQIMTPLFKIIFESAEILPIRKERALKKYLKKNEGKQ